MQTHGPAVHFSGIEGLNVVGQVADADSLAEGTSLNDTLDVTLGADSFSGQITGGQSGAFAFVPVTFSGIAGFVAPASGTFNSSNGLNIAGAAGGTDSVAIDGTAGDDTFSTDSSFSIFNLGIRVTSGGTAHTPILLDKVNDTNHTVLRGLD